MQEQKKYKLTDETKSVRGHILHRIEALIDFADVHAGDKGGFVEDSDLNLSHAGNAWIYDNACVYEYARVCDDATVRNNACVFGSACLYDRSSVEDYARVSGGVKLCDKVTICDCSRISVKISIGCYDANSFSRVYGAIISEVDYDD